jgi:murein DD-endopeptidase MepM/ murein hydrolase activator NlpD
VRPVPGKVVGPFGRRSVINGQPRRHHGGVDFRAATGQPIHAAARGRVALVDDTFFGGIVVLLDHGWGLISGYRHLCQALVRPGQKVARGDVIAKAGASGRVTGPHLHFDVTLGGSRVDPLAWIEASRKLARSSGED